MRVFIVAVSILMLAGPASGQLRQKRIAQIEKDLAVTKANIESLQRKVDSLYLELTVLKEPSKDMRLETWRQRRVARIGHFLALAKLQLRRWRRKADALMLELTIWNWQRPMELLQ